MKEFCERVREQVMLPWITPSKWHLGSVKGSRGWRFLFLEMLKSKKKKREHWSVLVFSCQLENRKSVLWNMYLHILSDENYNALMVGKRAGAMCSQIIQDPLCVKTNTLIFNLEVTLDQHRFTSNIHWFNIRILFSFFLRVNSFLCYLQLTNKYKL